MTMPRPQHKLQSVGWKSVGLQSNVLWRWAMIASGISVAGTLAPPALAQSVVLDGSLGPAPTLTGPDYDIEQRLGAAVGENLFHSFSQLDLMAGERAIFRSSAAIENIFARVTGGRASSIDGELSTARSVNLFLINPSGLLFGPNATLNVGGAMRGSFFATTADGVIWPEGGQFSGLNPEPSSALLTISGDPSGFVASGRSLPRLEVQGANLKVRPGQSLTLLGGEVTVDNATLGLNLQQAGWLNLGSLAGAGEVGLERELEHQGNDWRLTFPDSALRGDISITNEAWVRSRAQQPGGLSLHGHNITMSGNSQLLGGITSRGDDLRVQAPAISIDAQGQFTMTGNSRIANHLERFGLGQPGDIDITASTVSLQDGANVTAITQGLGDAGTVTISATEQIKVDGATVASLVQLPQGDADLAVQGGDVIINTAILEVLNGGQLRADTEGLGNAGRVEITTGDRALFSGWNAAGTEQSGAFSRNRATGMGNAGAIIITGPKLEVLDGAQLRANSFSQGDAGQIRITVNEQVRFEGRHANGEPSMALSRLGEQGIGQGGEIEINTAVLEVLNGAELQAETRGIGDAGRIVINGSDRVLFQGTGRGEAGNPAPSAAMSLVAPSGRGNGGVIRIHTPRLDVVDGAQLRADTQGQGNAGNVMIQAEDVQLQGEDPTGTFLSSAVSEVGQTGVGNGGQVAIETARLVVSEGARLRADTEGVGDGGDIVVTASDAVLLEGASTKEAIPSGAFSRVRGGAVGNGGEVRIETTTLEVRDGAQLRANTFGRGDAGNVSITAREQVRFAGRHISGEPSTAVSRVGSQGVGQGGAIAINTAVLEVLDGAELQAETLGQGDAGRLQLSASDLIRFEGKGINAIGEPTPSAAVSRVGFGGVGQGGEMEIETGRLEVLDGAELRANTRGNGDAGQIVIEASDRVLLDGIYSPDGSSSGLFTDNGIPNSPRSGEGRGGDVQVTAPGLTLRNGAVINARTVGDRPGGNIRLSLAQLAIEGGAQLLSTSDGRGAAGNVMVNAGESISLQGSDASYGERLSIHGDRVTPTSPYSALTVRSNGGGPAGNIVLNSERLQVENNAQIIAESTSGNGGNILIGARPIEPEFDAVFGTVVVQPPEVILLRDGGLLSTTAGDRQNPGDGGNILIQSPFVLGLPDGNSDIVANAFEGTGGNITIGAIAILNFDVQDEPVLDQLRAGSSNSISASSEFGSNGLLTLSGLDVDPSQGLAELPSGLADAGQDISRRCAAQTGRAAGGFYMTGRGGLPHMPRNTVTSFSPSQIRAIAPASARGNPTKIVPAPLPMPLTEAQAWQRQADGSIQLLPGRLALGWRHPSCHPETSKKPK